MEFFTGLSFGYKIMVAGILIFIVGVIIMMFENRKDKRSAEKIKTDYLVKNNVHTADNPVITMRLINALHFMLVAIPQLSYDKY